MKIKYKQSIKQSIAEAVQHAKESNLDIEYIQLAESEYIQLLEELSDLARVILIDPITRVRSYCGVVLRVVP